jgi:hypothetical protein
MLEMRLQSESIRFLSLCSIEDWLKYHEAEQGGRHQYLGYRARARNARGTPEHVKRLYL